MTMKIFPRQDKSTAGANRYMRADDKIFIYHDAKYVLE